MKLAKPEAKPGPLPDAERDAISGMLPALWPDQAGNSRTASAWPVGLIPRPRRQDQAEVFGPAPELGNKRVWIAYRDEGKAEPLA